MADKSLRQLRRDYLRNKNDPEVAAKYLAERLRGDTGLTLMLIQRLIRVERELLQVKTNVRARERVRSKQISVQDILRWLDRPEPEPLVRKPQPAPGPIEMSARAVTMLPFNSGYNSDVLLTRRCIDPRCGHRLGVHERPPEDRGRCLERGCQCQRLRRPPPPRDP